MKIKSFLIQLSIVWVLCVGDSVVASNQLKPISQEDAKKVLVLSDQMSSAQKMKDLNRAKFKLDNLLKGREHQQTIVQKLYTFSLKRIKKKDVLKVVAEMAAANRIYSLNEILPKLAHLLKREGQKFTSIMYKLHAERISAHIIKNIEFAIVQYNQIIKDAISGESAERLSREIEVVWKRVSPLLKDLGMIHTFSRLKTEIVENIKEIKKEIKRIKHKAEVAVKGKKE